MRKYIKQGGFSVCAMSGTYVVMLGLNAKEEAIDGLLGFAIHRTDHTEDEQYWLKGFKTFKETEPNPTPGALYSTLEHQGGGHLSWRIFPSLPSLLFPLHR